MEMPAYLKRNDYVPPSSPKNGIFQDTFNCKGMSLFEYYGEHPAKGRVFNDCMTGYGGHRESWVSIYPTENILNGSKDGALVVDVGGNVGQHLEQFRLKHPGFASRLILQDLPEVVARAECGAKIQRMSYDFFTPQPVKGECAPRLFHRALKRIHTDRFRRPSILSRFSPA